MHTTIGRGRPVLPAAQRGALCPVDQGCTPTGVPFSSTTHATFRLYTDATNSSYYVVENNILIQTPTGYCASVIGCKQHTTFRLYTATNSSYYVVTVYLQTSTGKATALLLQAVQAAHDPENAAVCTTLSATSHFKTLSTLF
eukprot:1183325-Prorocentrum_minimum.AAC.1